MKVKNRYTGLALVALLLVAAFGLAACRGDVPLAGLGTTNFEALGVAGNVAVAVPTNVATATPALAVNQTAKGVGVLYQDGGVTALTVGHAGNVIVAPTAAATGVPALQIEAKGAGNLLEMRNSSGTPLAQWSSAGAVIMAPAQSAAQQFNNAVQVAPTPLTTATPGLYINNTSVGASSLLIADAATPVVEIYNSGEGVWSVGQTHNNWLKVSAPTAIATATPAAVIDSAGVSVLLDVRDAATPVFSVNNGGAVVASNGSTWGNAVYAAVPTAVGTATPALFANSAGGVGNLFELRQAATPVFQVDKSGNVIAGQAGTWSNAQYVAVPTAVGTATPAIMVNSAGGVSNLLELRRAATPVVYFDSVGAITGKGGTWANAHYIAVPTAIATATPALFVNSAGGVSNLLELRQAATPVFSVASAGAVTVGNDGASADVTFYSNTAGDNLQWVAADEALTITGTNGQDALNIADGNVDIEDNVDIDGTLDVAGAVALAADVTLSGPSTGNNAGGRVEFIGLPRIRLVSLDQGTNPASQTIAWMDANPTGEWAEVDSGTTITVTADTGYYRDSTNSLKLAWGDVTDNDGVDGTVTQVDLTDMESLGFWILSDTALTSGDFDVTLDDTNGTDQVYTVGAVSANVWTWVELNISACDANCDTVDGVQFLATAQGGTAHGTINIWLDAVYVWDATDEDALGFAILQDGVLGVVDAESGDYLEEWTNYIVHYETGNDFLVWITDESLSDVVALIAY